MNAARDLAANGKQVVDAGGVVVEILAATAGSPATKAQLDAWVNTYALPVSSVRDPDSLPLQSLTALYRREIAYIVDLQTMQIVSRIDGSTAGVQPNAVRQSITIILSLLGAKSG